MLMINPLATLPRPIGSLGQKAMQLHKEYLAKKITLDQLVGGCLPMTNEMSQAFYVDKLAMAKSAYDRALSSKDYEIISYTKREVSKYVSRLSGWKYWEDKKQMWQEEIHG